MATCLTAVCGRRKWQGTCWTSSCWRTSEECTLAFLLVPPFSSSHLLALLSIAACEAITLTLYPSTSSKARKVTESGGLKSKHCLTSLRLSTDSNNWYLRL